MSKASNLVFSNESESISAEVIEDTYNKVTEYLRSKYSCLFRSKNHLKWAMSIQCRKITILNIAKIRNDADVDLLGNTKVKIHKKK